MPVPTFPFPGRAVSPDCPRHGRQGGRHFESIKRRPELSDSAFFRSNIPPFPSTTKRGTLFPEFLLDKAGLSDKLTSMCLCFVVSRHENASDLDFQQLQDFALPFEAVSSVRIEFVFDHLLAVVVADVVRSWVLRFGPVLVTSRQSHKVICLVEDKVNVGFRVVDQFQGQTSDGRTIHGWLANRWLLADRRMNGVNRTNWVYRMNRVNNNRRLWFTDRLDRSHDGERGDWWIG